MTSEAPTTARAKMPGLPWLTPSAGPGTPLTPIPATAGPWSPDTMHGAAVNGLLGAALLGAGPLFPARVTVDLLAPVPIQPMRVAVRTLREGRTYSVVEAALHTTRPVAIARAVMTRAAPEPPVPATSRTSRPGEGLPHRDHVAWPCFVNELVEVRHLPSPPSGAAGAAWLRLVPGTGADEAGYLALLSVADFAAGLGNTLDPEHAHPVNVDTTVHVHRPPAGAWVGVSSAPLRQTAGTMLLADAELLDAHGVVGHVRQTVVAVPA